MSGVARAHALWMWPQSRVSSGPQPTPDSKSSGSNDFNAQNRLEPIFGYNPQKTNKNDTADSGISVILRGGSGLSHPPKGERYRMRTYAISSHSSMGNEKDEEVKEE